MRYLGGANSTRLDKLLTLSWIILLGIGTIFIFFSIANLNGPFLNFLKIIGINIPAIADDIKLITIDFLSQCFCYE